MYLAIEDESVAGLNVNAPVKYNGVDVGKVRNIQLDPSNPDRVNLLFAINHNTPIREDTVAVLKTQGLTGIAYVELSSTAHNSPLLHKTAGYEYPVIRTKPSLGARLENVLTTVLASLDSTSKHINSILSDQNQENFKNTLSDLATIAHTIALRKDAIDHGLRNADLTLNNTTRLTAQAGPVIDQIGRSAESISTMGKEVSRTSINAGKSLNSIGSDLKGFTDVSLPELDRLIGELNALSASMRRLSEQTERNPNSLLFGITPVPDGPGETPTVVRKP
ncbi:mce related protein [Solimicrobium silvestre]|uniref:Mce related protein n=2 Tax=Solimicrobium silvestre TaxID=2099400 RepID=A0A2S9GUN8_9BURK|nr:mce related protein [Solimicrobium silvestre]